MKYSLLLNDFYQFTMAYGYWKLGVHEQKAVFHLFYRQKQVGDHFIVASGLQNVIDFLQSFHLTDDDLHFLSQQKKPVFSAEFLQYLKTLRFTADVDAVSEGTIVFANEPILRITAPLILCQLLETPVINFVNFSSAVSTVAARIRHCVQDDWLFEFGVRRAQGPNGGMTASRAAFLGGCDATSHVLAGKEYGIPVIGTMAHSWVMAFDDESASFAEYARMMPENIIFLVDTYDTAKGVDHAITVAKTIKKENKILKGIRLDSGDLYDLSVQARQKLNDAGFQDTKIYVSGDLSETKIADLKARHAPIDGWGVGTYLTTAYSQPALDMVYKLGAIEKKGVWHDRLKRSDNPRKTTDPGILQVRRFFEHEKWLKDVIYHTKLGIESHDQFHDLLIPIFRDGKCVYAHPGLEKSRAWCLQQMQEFTASAKMPYCVEREPKLLQLKEALLLQAEKDE